MIMRIPAVYMVVFGVALAGCGATPRIPKVPVTQGTPVVEFPSRAEVESLTRGSVELPNRLPTIEVERWQITTSVPVPGAEYALETHWDRLLGEWLSGSAPAAAGTRASPELRCAASEAARFFAELGAYPTYAMLQYVTQRCGSTVTTPFLGGVQAVVPEGVPLEQLENDFGPNVKKLLGEAASAKNRDVGIGFARRHGRAVVVVVAGERHGTLDGFSPLIQGAGVTLEGQIDEPWTVAFGLVTRGPHGVEVCEAEAGVPAPEFRIFCPIRSDQDTARIQIVLRRPKRVLYEPAFDALVRRSEEAGLSYIPVLFGFDAVAADGEAFREALYGALNEVRKSAGVRPLQIEMEQSIWNDRATTAFYQAWFESDSEVLDQTTLGMLAGWDVAGTIRDAGIFWSISPNGRRPARWLGSAIESPLGRWVLLERSMSRVAVSSIDIGQSGTGVLLTTYALFEPSDQATAVATLMKSLTAERAAFGRSRPAFRPPSAELTAALARIEREGISASSALNVLLADLAGAGVPVHGAWFEAIDLRELNWLSELVDPSTLDLELGVTHYKPNGAAWGQYAVLVLAHRTQSGVAKTP